VKEKGRELTMSDKEIALSEALFFEEVEPGVGLVTMRRPDKLNAINLAMVEGFEELFRMLADNDQVRVIVLTGEGRGFCSGADLADAVARARQEIFSTAEKFLRNVQERFSNLVLGLRRIPQPIIAAVNGPAAGGGFAFALASDIRFATPEAYFVASFVNIGLTAGEMGTSYILPRVVGMSRAAEILFSGRKVPAEEAERIGLVTRVVPQEELLPEAMALAKTMLGKSYGGLVFTKTVLDQNASAPSLEAAIELENRNQTIMVVSGEFFRQITSFGK